MRVNPQETADLVTFTGEVVNGKLNFFCSVLQSSINLTKFYHVENFDSIMAAV